MPVIINIYAHFHIWSIPAHTIICLYRRINCRILIRVVTLCAYIFGFPTSWFIGGDIMLDESVRYTHHICEWSYSDLYIRNALIKTLSFRFLWIGQYPHVNWIWYGRIGGDLNEQRKELYTLLWCRCVDDKNEIYLFIIETMILELNLIRWHFGYDTKQLQSEAFIIAWSLRGTRNEKLFNRLWEIEWDVSSSFTHIFFADSTSHE